MSTPQERLGAVLSHLSAADVASLLSAKNLWHTTSIPGKGVPSLRVSDGPNGVRGIHTFNGSKTAAFPCATALASSWCPDLLEEVGDEMACQAKAKGVHVVLAPTINIHRSPLGGRSFESYSEDPVLSGKLASGLVRGLQKQGIAATVKHFVCNDQETNRTKIDVVIDERSLREIYLKPFQIVVREANPWAVMASYNRVNGIHVSENKVLLDGVLRREWGWEGLIMSDWFGTYSTSDAINAGLDLEMPGPSVMRGSERIARVVDAGKVEVSTVIARAKNMLELTHKVAKSGVPEDAPELEDDSPKSRTLNRRAAGEAIVLLKNSSNVLPLKKSGTIAVIGPNAKKDVSTGGGSASLSQYYFVSAFDGITKACESSETTNTTFSQGCFSHEMLPLLQSRTASGEAGLDIEFLDGDFSPEATRKAITSISTSVARMVFFASLPQGVGPLVWARISGTFTPESDGIYEFSLVTTGRANLLIDNEMLVNNWDIQEKGLQFFGHGTKEVKGSITLKGGKDYKVEVQYSNLSLFPDRRPADLGGGALRIGCCAVVDPELLIADAVKAAAEADTVILCLGTDQERESEGFDRTDMKLPSLQDKLASAVLAVNPITVIVNFSGAPVEMPWAGNASTIIQAWFLGSELGNALADILFGTVNPSGKLPVSFPKRLEDNPSHGNFPGENGRVKYAEGLLVGYRHYTTNNVSTLFHFGHGLSYTSFQYNELRSDRWIFSAESPLKVSIDIINTGKVAGHETVQLYISAQGAASVSRPIRELQAFQKIRDVKPGETQTIDFLVNKYALSVYEEENANWVVKSGDYMIQVGASVEDIKSQHLVTIKDSFTWTGI